MHIGVCVCVCVCNTNSDSWTIILCSVDRASLYNLVNKTNLVHNLFLVYVSISTCFRRLCAHHQEKQLYLCDTWYLLFCMDDCLVCRVEGINILRKTVHKVGFIYKMSTICLYIYVTRHSKSTCVSMHVGVSPIQTPKQFFFFFFFNRHYNP
jgi:hypothetical protein